MHRRFVVAAALWGVTFGTACPETYGKGGYLDDAMEQDIRQQMQERREQSRREKEKAPRCGDGRSAKKICDDPAHPDECHWECR